MRAKEILPDHDDESNELDYRSDVSEMFFPRCHACGRVAWWRRAFRARGKWYCERLCVPAFYRLMKVSRHALWLLLVAVPAFGSDLPPCHPFFPPGTACQMPAIPPPGGALQAAPPSPCGATTPPGATCVWPDVEVRPVEVVGTGYANPDEPLYRHTALFLVPRPALEIPLFVEVTVINYQRNMQDPRFCGTGNEHRYYESAFWFRTDNCPPVEPES